MQQSPLYVIMHLIGDDLIMYWTKFEQRLFYLSDTIECYTVGGLMVAESLAVEGDDDPVLALEAYLNSRPTEVAITITNDDRGDGVTLFRRNDHPGVDFSKLEGEDGVIFAHKNGFVAKLAKSVTNEQRLRLLERAVS